MSTAKLWSTWKTLFRQIWKVSFEYVLFVILYQWSYSQMEVSYRVKENALKGNYFVWRLFLPFFVQQRLGIYIFSFFLSFHLKHDGTLTEHKKWSPQIYMDVSLQRKSWNANYLYFLHSNLNVKVLDSGQVLSKLLHYYNCQSLTVLYKFWPERCHQWFIWRVTVFYVLFKCIFCNKSVLSKRRSVHIVFIS